MMTVRVINKSDNDLPNYETIGSAGCDVRSTHSANNLSW
jgi:dUTPase